MSYDELIKVIEAAFSDVPTPRDNIICHECNECFELHDALFGRAPNDLSDAWIERNFDQLPLLSDDAKQFFFPAYLRIGALKPDSLVSQFILYALEDDFRWQPSGGYSSQQKGAILDYLNYVEPRMEDDDRNSFEKARKLWS